MIRRIMKKRCTQRGKKLYRLSVLEFTIPQIAAFCATIAVVRGNFFGYHTSIEVSERNEERTMKKLLSLLLPLALLLSLTACGEKSAD